MIIRPVALDLKVDDEALTYPFSYDKDEIADLTPAMQRHYPDPNDEVGRWARQFVRLGRPTETGHLLMTLCYAIRESFVYARRQNMGRRRRSRPCSFVPAPAGISRF